VEGGVCLWSAGDEDHYPNDSYSCEIFACPMFSFQLAPEQENPKLLRRYYQE
jgi:hypothetical protein